MGALSVWLGGSQFLTECMEASVPLNEVRHTRGNIRSKCLLLSFVYMQHMKVTHLGVC